jgi:hypothetical protein
VPFTVPAVGDTSIAKLEPDDAATVPGWKK